MEELEAEHAKSVNAFRNKEVARNHMKKNESLISGEIREPPVIMLLIDSNPQETVHV